MFDSEHVYSLNQESHWPKTNMLPTCYGQQKIYRFQRSWLERVEQQKGPNDGQGQHTLRTNSSIKGGFTSVEGRIWPLSANLRDLQSMHERGTDVASIFWWLRQEHSGIVWENSKHRRHPEKGSVSIRCTVCTLAFVDVWLARTLLCSVSVPDISKTQSLPSHPRDSDTDEVDLRTWPRPVSGGNFRHQDNKRRRLTSRRHMSGDVFLRQGGESNALLSLSRSTRLIPSTRCRQQTLTHRQPL